MTERLAVSRLAVDLLAVGVAEFELNGRVIWRRLYRAAGCGVDEGS